MFDWYDNTKERDFDEAVTALMLEEKRKQANQKEGN